MHICMVSTAHSLLSNNKPALAMTIDCKNVMIIHKRRKMVSVINSLFSENLSLLVEGFPLLLIKHLWCIIPMCSYNYSLGFYIDDGKFNINKISLHIAAYTYLTNALQIHRNANIMYMCFISCSNFCNKN